MPNLRYHYPTSATTLFCQYVVNDLQHLVGLLWTLKQHEGKTLDF
jgi:hypothetical protein